MKIRLKTKQLMLACVAGGMGLFLHACKGTTPVLPPPSLDTTNHEIEWVTDSLGYFSSRFLDVWGKSPSSLYAVGQLLSEGTEPDNFIAQFDGTIWRTIVDDSLRWWIAGGILAGINGLSDTSMVVVGSVDNGYGVTGFAGRWNGKRWSNISPDSSHALYSVWMRAEGDIYATGAHGTLLRFDGTKWESLQTGTTLDIWQITGSADGEIYAVASDNYNSLAGSVILRVSANTVTQDRSFSLGRMFGIWEASNGDIYATGEGTFKKSSVSAWQEIATPSPKVALFSVAGTGPNNVIVAGAYGAVIHWSGSSWNFYPELYDQSSSRSYFKALAIGNSYFLVGNTPDHALITIGRRRDP